MPESFWWWRSRRPARTAHQVVVRGLTSLALVWQVLWLAADSSLWPWHQTTGAGRLAFFLAAISWIGLLVSQVVGDRRLRRASRTINVAALVVAAIVELLEAASAGTGWTAASNATVLAVGAAGILLPPRQAAAATTVVVAVEAGVLIAADTTTPAGVYPWFAVAVAVAAIAARNALVREALEVDAAAAESIRRETDRRVHEAVESTLRQQERALHGTVLSTLASIERGGLAGTLRDRLTRLCRESAEVLRALRTDPGALGGVDDAVEQAGDVGEEVRFAPSASALALPVLLAFGALSTLVAVTTASFVRYPRVDLVALGLLLATCAVVVLFSRRGGIGAWLVVLVAIAGIGTARIHLAAEPSEASAWFDWASVGVAMLFFVVAAVGPWWAWAVVLVAWFVLQGDVFAELLSSGTAILVAGALFGRTTRRNAARIEQARAAQHAQALASAVADASVRRLHLRYAALAESEALTVLEGVAAGRLSPDDPAVRRQAAVEERFVRNLIRVDPQAGPLPEIVGELARSARRAGLLLSCDVGDVPLASANGLATLRSSLLTAVALARSGTDAVLSARRESDEVVVRLSLEIPPSLTAAAEALAVPGCVLDHDPLSAGAAGRSVTMAWQWSTPAQVAALADA